LLHLVACQAFVEEDIQLVDLDSQKVVKDRQTVVEGIQDFEVEFLMLEEDTYLRHVEGILLEAETLLVVDIHLEVDNPRDVAGLDTGHFDLVVEILLDSDT